MRCPHPYCSPHQVGMCVVPPSSISFSVLCPPNVIICLCRTRLCLGFYAKLRIRQIPACKMKPQIVVFVCYLAPSSTWIFECGTPSLSLYYFKLRSVLEANCVIYHPMLTQEEANDIERIQKIVLRIILAHKYENYTQACLLMNIETLQSRRINLSLNFGLKCIIVINTLTYSNSTTKFL